MKKWVISLSIMVIVVAAASVFVLAQSKMPGIGLADEKAGGCLDCHKVAADGTDRTLAKSSPASHAKFSATMMKDLKGCYTCHAKRGDMGRIMHEAHYEGENNYFVRGYNGYCTHCHAVNTATGAITVKGK